MGGGTNAKISKKRAKSHFIHIKSLKIADFAHTLYMLYTDRQGEAAGALCCALAGDDYVSKLEKSFAAITGKNAVALCSGDAALHTALHLCGVADGDYVFVPTFTFYSYISTVAHVGGVPVFLDCDPHTRCISASALEAALVWSELQNKPPKAVVADNAFGAVADYDVLYPLCKAWGVPLIELAFDALGGNYRGVPCGANGDYGALGFRRRISGGGGILVCGDDVRAAEEFARRRYSEGESYDYSLHNLLAALDYAQLDAAEKAATRARKNLDALCKKFDFVAPPTAGDAATYALVKAAGYAADLRAAGFDVKKPPLVHTLAQYRDCHYFEHEQGFSACRAYDGYCLINTDMSSFARKKLERLLGSYSG